MLNEGLVLTHRPFFIGLIGPQAPYQINLRFSSFAPRQLMQASLLSAWRRFTRGSLPSVAMVKAGDVLVSDIKVGALQIGAETTVAELANAVIAYNDGWQAGDQVTFFYGVQTEDAVTGIPRARIYGYKVMLNRRTKQEQRPNLFGLCLARRRKREA